MDERTSATPPAIAEQGGIGQYKGRDLDPARRPGVPRLHAPERLQGARWPIERQRSDVTVFMHGRPHKTFPPVFGTAEPPHGISGLIRRAAYAYPDHAMRHWSLLLFADRVDAWGYRARRLLPWLAPVVALGALAYGAASRVGPWRGRWTGSRAARFARRAAFD
ncbi:hypothetical protein [Anaeromyxobacter paludicola]|uniref:Uncharacterized protein n=1 Tax=Anaeromyxobacter paludicola TaxID=2918171 RepID=A0ABM7X667_9BACT|nr:hypothetical protein [Anaeromyxobacter paludicola]BDG07319.1 hypothetical protein AMPC_04320 [Anaeromyxobacter paludicola]